MSLRNTIPFKKQDKNIHINFFEVKKPFSITEILFETYLIWLFKSTLDFKSKMKLIEVSKTKPEITKAIEILKNNYAVNFIAKRNKQLNEYFLSKRNPP
jgi:hypothetical protein